LNKERLEVEAAIRRFAHTTAEVDALLEMTLSQTEHVLGLSGRVPTADHQSFSDDESG
jgi:calcineurin-like phosphoesterase